MPIPPLSKGCSARGADMGRPNVHAVDRTASIKFHVEYMPFFDGAYDRGGAYWGSPANLWRAVSTEEVWCVSNWDGTSFKHRVELYFRANSRDVVKHRITTPHVGVNASELLGYTNARFFR